MSVTVLLKGQTAKRPAKGYIDQLQRDDERFINGYYVCFIAT